MTTTPRMLSTAAAAAFCAPGLGSLTPEALACSRVTWVGPANQVITGRSMDWPYGFNSRFHVIPRGNGWMGSVE